MPRPGSARPLQLAELVVVDPQQRIGGDHHVCGGDNLTARHTALGRRLGEADDPEGANLAASFNQLETTLVGATTRKGGCSGQLSRAWQMSERLQGLAKPHVVGEDAAQLMGPQEAQPAVALELIRPQRGPQRLWNLNISDRGNVDEAAYGLLPASRLVDRHAQALEVLPQAWKAADGQLRRCRSCSALDSSIKSRNWANSDRSKENSCFQDQEVLVLGEGDEQILEGTVSPSIETLMRRSNQSAESARSTAATCTLG